MNNSPRGAGDFEPANGRVSSTRKMTYWVLRQMNRVRNRVVRHEVAVLTVYGQLVREQQALCFATGILRRQALGRAYVPGSEAFRTMEQTWESQSGGATRIG